MTLGLKIAKFSRVDPPPPRAPPDPLLDLCTFNTKINSSMISLLKKLATLQE